MDAKTVIRILTDVTGFLPGASSFHALLVAHPDQAALVIPVVQNLDEGASALEAAERAAPELTAAIKNLVDTSVRVPAPAPGMIEVSTAKASENFLRSLGGVGVMSPDQERAWMDRTAAQATGDSRNGSG